MSYGVRNIKSHRLKMICKVGRQRMPPFALGMPSLSPVSSRCSSKDIKRQFGSN